MKSSKKLEARDPFRVSIECRFASPKSPLEFLYPWVLRYFFKPRENVEIYNFLVRYKIVNKWRKAQWCNGVHNGNQRSKAHIFTVFALLFCK